MHIDFGINFSKLANTKPMSNENQLYVSFQAPTT